MATGTVLVPEEQRKNSCDSSRPADRFEFNEDYLARLRSRDMQTWQHFDKLFRPRIRSKFRAQFHWELVDDLTEDVMVAVIEKIDHGQPREAARLPAYVYAICNNKAREAIPKVAGERAFAEVDCDRFASRARSPQEACLAREDAGEIQKILAGMSPRDRAVLVNVCYHGKDRDEVCKESGVTREQLKMILFRARQRFQCQWRRR